MVFELKTLAESSQFKEVCDLLKSGASNDLAARVTYNICRLLAL
jgi:hypothetical protein